MGLTALKHTTETEVSRKPCGALHYSENYADYLMIVQRSFPVDATVDEVKRNAIRAEFVYLSADGRSWTDGWHHGPECGETVYVEKHTTGGCVFHGWIDKGSRRIVQAG